MAGSGHFFVTTLVGAKTPSKKVWLNYYDPMTTFRNHRNHILVKSNKQIATIEKLAQMVLKKVGERSLITLLQLHSVGTYHEDIACKRHIYY